MEFLKMRQRNTDSKGRARVSDRFHWAFPKLFSHWSSSVCCRGLIHIRHSSLLSVLPPPSSASSRGRSGETKTSRRGTGKCQRSGNAGWGPRADSPRHVGWGGGPTLRDRPISLLLPNTAVPPPSPKPPYTHKHTPTELITAADPVQCTGSVPRRDLWPSLRESALSRPQHPCTGAPVGSSLWEILGDLHLLGEQEEQASSDLTVFKLRSSREAEAPALFI